MAGVTGTAAPWRWGSSGAGLTGSSVGSSGILGLWHDTCQNSPVRTVTALVSLPCSEQLFSTCGIPPFGTISLPTARVFLSPDRAIPAASHWKQLLWVLIFFLMSQLQSSFMGAGVGWVRFLLVMHVKRNKYLILYWTRRFISKTQ